MRRFLRPILIFLAILFLIEAWLWDKLEPVVARIVRVIPLQRIKAAIARWVETLPPASTLIVFAVPVLLLIPVKIFEFWLFANGRWMEAIGALVFAKMMALGTTAFVFDVTRDKLLQLDWFRVLYDYVMWLRQWAHDMVEPVRRRIALRLHILGPDRAPRAWRLLKRIRRRMQVQPAE